MGMLRIGAPRCHGPRILPTTGSARRASVAIFINAGLLARARHPGLACGLHSCSAPSRRPPASPRRARRFLSPGWPRGHAACSARRHCRHAARPRVRHHREADRPGGAALLVACPLLGRAQVRPAGVAPVTRNAVRLSLTTGGGGIPRAGFPGSSLRSLRSLRPITGPVIGCRATWARGNAPPAGGGRGEVAAVRRAARHRSGPHRHSGGALDITSYVILRPALACLLAGFTAAPPNDQQERTSSFERSRGGEVRASREGNGGRACHGPRARHDSRTALRLSVSAFAADGAAALGSLCAVARPGQGSFDPAARGAPAARPVTRPPRGAAHAGAASPARSWLSSLCSLHRRPRHSAAPELSRRFAPLPSAPTRARRPRPWPELAASASSLRRFARRRGPRHRRSPGPHGFATRASRRRCHAPLDRRAREQGSGSLLLLSLLTAPPPLAVCAPCSPGQGSSTPLRGARLRRGL